MTFKVLQAFGGLEGGESDKLTFPETPFEVDPLLMVNGMGGDGEVNGRVRRTLRSMLRVKEGERMTAGELLEDGEGVFKWNAEGGGGRPSPAFARECVGETFRGTGNREEDERRGKGVLERRRGRRGGGEEEGEWKCDWGERLGELRAM